MNNSNVLRGWLRALPQKRYARGIPAVALLAGLMIGNALAVTPLVSEASSWFYVDSGGNIGIGTSTPQHKLDVAGAMYSELVTATSSVNWNVGNVQTLTLSSDQTLTFSNGQAGGEYTLILNQDSTGGRQVTWPASVKWVNGSSLNLSATSTGVDIVNFVYDGTNYIGTHLGPPTYAKFDAGKCNADWTLSEDQLLITKTSANVWRSCLSNVGKSTGKWYWEVTVTANGDTGGGSIMLGVGNSSVDLTDYLGKTGWAFEGATNTHGDTWDNNTITDPWGSPYSTGDTIMIALDMNAGKIWFGKNGSWLQSGDPVAGTNPAYSDLSGTLYAGAAARVGTTEFTANFGASAFKYAVPTGFHAGLYQ
jgi:hypothetical protein